ncbi:MAG: hypothetical protein CR982_03430 [Candidatus Cloacimonadota bacterium]|nr:MAG: hypothetical protein CR982_03430 [Candidatus Cloacimonadota bacterium]PIE78835.1 MAG: hypothetical protein CSA15_05885 [Candidatus Delongbacteria bacterium]
MVGKISILILVLSNILFGFFDMFDSKDSLMIEVDEIVGEVKRRRFESDVEPSILKFKSYKIVKDSIYLYLRFAYGYRGDYSIESITDQFGTKLKFRPLNSFSKDDWVVLKKGSLKEIHINGVGPLEKNFTLKYPINVETSKDSFEDFIKILNPQFADGNLLPKKNRFTLVLKVIDSCELFIDGVKVTPIGDIVTFEVVDKNSILLDIKSENGIFSKKIMIK